jgi:LytS/YehU family sensor histidine kinase
MISSTMYKNIKTADKMLTHLSDLLRISLHSANREEYTLRKELEMVNLYIEIMKARFDDKLSINLNIDDDTLNALVPNFILQPLLENSIKFSMQSIEDVKIVIESKKENNSLSISIKDNGPGISESKEKILKNGVGLSNTVERLEKLYSKNQQFHLQNINDGGMEVRMVIPFQQADSGEKVNE